MRGIFRWVAAAGLLAGCGGAVPPAPEAPAAAAKPAAISPGMMEAVRQATDRSQLRVDTVTLPSGERLKRASLGSGYQHVVLGRRNADGTLSTACVNTAAGAETFLSGRTGAGAGQ